MARLTREDIKDCVLPLKSNKPAKKELQSFAFTTLGKHDRLTNEYGENAQDGDKSYPLISDPNSTNAFARIDIGNQTRYYIRMNSSGKFYNPSNSYGETRHNKEIRHATNDKWAFREVNYKVYMYYLNFLKTANIAWLNNCERESF